MIYQIKFSEEALKDIERLKRKWKQICIKEISEVVLELQEHPIQELVR
jgi:mRNA-degrading endonuclease RelE of RelBE toxin-antitoxin system